MQRGAMTLKTGRKGRLLAFFSMFSGSQKSAAIGHNSWQLTTLGYMYQSKPFVAGIE
jgi:hypothetical protein